MASFSLLAISGASTHSSSPADPHPAVNVAIYQPYFFPYLGYWQLLDAADVFVIGDEFQYMTRGFINRNTVLLDHTPHRFTISLSGSSPRKRINEIAIRDDFRKFRAMLKHAYGKAAHYPDAMEVINRVLCHPDRNLARFLEHQIATVAEYLGLRARIVRMSDLPLAEPSLSRERRLCDCTRLVGGDRIINPIGSRSLYSPADFSEHRVALAFLRTRETPYPQGSREFVPNLSLIDAMMHNDRTRLNALVKHYDIIEHDGTVLWTSE